VRTYKRLRIEGGCYFFTVNLANRHNNDLLVREILHTIWQLPPDDHDFSTRWRLIKSRFSQAIETGEVISESRLKKGERGIWQRRFWEHVIRDNEDYARHVDYIHYNPVKHGLCARAADWPYSSFSRWVDRGVYSGDWAAGDSVSNLTLD
jgi:putative transposase